MTWRRPTKEELAAAPLPLVWWHDYEKLLVRGPARKQYHLSVSIAALGIAAYQQVLDTDMLVEGYLGDGRPVVQWLTLAGVIEEHQTQGFASALDLVLDHDLRDWVVKNSGGIGDLIRWQLAHTYVTRLMSRCVMAEMREPEGSTRRQRMFEVHSPANEAMGWANMAVLRAWNDPEVVAYFSASLWAGAVGTIAHSWPLPPYDL